MLIGSHNSLSYLPPKRWWMKPFHWMARCQRVSYVRQFYEYGVRVFDLRLWFDENGNMQVRHGRMVFDTGNTEEFVKCFLSFLNQVQGCAVRVILEEDKVLSRCPHVNDAEAYFYEWCRVFERLYPHVTFFGGNRKWDWAPIRMFPSKDISLDGKYSSTTSLFKTNRWQWLRYVDDLWPWLYARLHNKENFRKGTDKECLFVDFVDMQ